MKHMPLAGMWQLKAHLADEGGVRVQDRNWSDEQHSRDAYAANLPTWRPPAACCERGAATQLHCAIAFRHCGPDA